jgi:hypothetical protein
MLKIALIRMRQVSVYARPQGLSKAKNVNFRRVFLEKICLVSAVEYSIKFDEDGFADDIVRRSAFHLPLTTVLRLV